MQFQEHNGRKKADKFAEFITGEPLRRYLADKVKYYVGDSVSVFDGAAGSGQLEQFIQPRDFVAVEIQAEACEALKRNYPHAQVSEMSFFGYNNQAETACDCTVMNPPFSVKFKTLGESERLHIQTDFPWKKSGVVDDIFVLKGLSCSKRFGFFILPCGVAYRKTEEKFRALLGNQLVELNCIQNAFEDTSIDVLFLVVDKEKTTPTTKRELVNFKAETPLVFSDEWEINPEHWERIAEPAKPEDEVDFIGLEMLCRQQLKNSAVANIRISKMFVTLGEFPVSEYNAFCDEVSEAILVEKIPIGGL